jgi:hypothetical protein
MVVLTGPAQIHGAESKQKKVVCTGKVVDEQGRPIAGVKISLHEIVNDEATYTYDPKMLSEVQTGNDGAFSFKETVEENQYRYGYVIAEKRDLALGFDNWRMRDGNKELEITMGPSKELAGVVVDEKGVPVPDAQVFVSMLVLGEGREREHLNSLVVPRLLTTNTDSTGRFAFSHIPRGATAEFIVKKPGKATVSTYKRTGEPYQKLSFAEGQKDIKLILPVEAKIDGAVVAKNTDKPVGGVKIRYSSGQEVGYFRPKPIVAEEDGTFIIDSLVATSYALELIQPRDKLPDWVADPVEVITEAGKTKNGVKIELAKGGVLEVKVTDAVNNVPIDEAHVSVRRQVDSRYHSGRSDKNGMAYMRLMPGEYQIYYVYKQGYSRQRLQDTIMIEGGKTVRQEYELSGMPKITGIVRDETGKPLEGVELEICPGGRKRGICFGFTRQI